MPSILHRLTIDAPPERVHRLAATREGIEQWWTGRPVAGGDAVGGRFAVYFRDLARPAAVFELLERDAERIAWRCVEGPEDWLETRVTYVLRPREDGGTTLLFSHEGWRGENEFMHGCSTNWGSYLMSLKSGAEGGAFNAYPGGEVSRWD
ncbi:MAG TPA: SRPBCC domain-containing protein [Solirubrobacteraceae bacterium]|nr:SRPBCC domain-containing protein [Solirubrobacteraceae bacterium]